MGAAGVLGHGVAECLDENRLDRPWRGQLTVGGLGGQDRRDRRPARRARLDDRARQPELARRHERQRVQLQLGASHRLAPAAGSVKRRHRPVDPAGREQRREQAGPAGLPGRGGLPARCLAEARPAQRVVADDQDRDAVPRLLVVQAQQCGRAHGHAEGNEVSRVEAGHRRRRLKHPQAGLVGQRDARDEVTAAGVAGLGQRDKREDHVAGVDSRLARHVIRVIELGYPCGGRVNERGGLELRAYRRADDRGGSGRVHVLRETAKPRAGRLVQAAEQCRRRVDDARLDVRARVRGQCVVRHRRPQSE